MLGQSTHNTCIIICYARLFQSLLNTGFFKHRPVVYRLFEGDKCFHPIVAYVYHGQFWGLMYL